MNYDYGTGENDQLSRVQKLKIGTTEIVDYSYLGMNRVAIEKYTEPSTDIENTIVTGSGSNPYAALDRFGRVTNLLWKQGSTDLVDYTYTHDRIGNKLTQNVNDATALTDVDELYSYDELYRLKSYDRGDLSGSSITNPTLTQDWTLDQTGNWSNFQQGVVDTLNQTRTSNTTNEITNITASDGATWDTPAYDGNGNMTEMPQPDDPTSSFDATWDAWNRLVKLDDSSTAIAGYQHDGLGRRVIKEKYTSGSLSATVHCYYSSQAQCLEERIDTSTVAASQYLWGLRFVDDLVLRDRDTNSNGTLDERLYALCDPRFSVVAITDETGSVQERYGYDGYGDTTVFTPSYANRTSSSFDWEFRYTGRRQDLDTLLYFFRARYFHPRLGLFVSRDPLGYLDGLSLYRAYFVPRNVDPRGGKSFVPEKPDFVREPGIDVNGGWVTVGNNCKCIMKICSKPVKGVPGSGHLFITLRSTCSEGEYAYRGGPTGIPTVNRVLGDLMGTSGVYDETFRDNPRHPSSTIENENCNEFEVGVGADSCRTVHKCFEKMIVAINECCLGYRPVGRNSNSLVGWLLSQCLSFSRPIDLPGPRVHPGVNRPVPKCVKEKFANT